MGGLPGLHAVDHGQVVSDCALHPFRYRDKFKNMRATLRPRPKVMDEILPTAFIQRVPDLQEHPMIIGQGEVRRTIVWIGSDGKSLRITMRIGRTDEISYRMTMARPQYSFC